MILGILIAFPVLVTLGYGITGSIRERQMKKANPNHYSEHGYVWSSSIMLGLMGGVLAIGVGMIIHAVDKETEMHYYATLVSMSDTTNSEGSFFLGSGTIKEDAVYYYYYRTNTGGFKRSYLYSARTEIVESDGSQAHIECEASRSVVQPDWEWAFTKRDRKCIAYVPRGTVKQEFNLDNQN